MGENEDSVLKVVRLFIDNINESTKTTSKELDRIGGQVEDVKSRVNTPPRNEELSLQIKVVDDKVEEMSDGLTTINISIKSMITAVKVAAAVMAFAIIIAGGIIHFSKYMENDNIEQKINQYLLDRAKERSDGITPETDGQG